MTAEQERKAQEIRENRREARERLGALVDEYKTALDANKTPAETIDAVVERLGLKKARATVAELVRLVGEWDGRIFPSVRAWAQGVEDAKTREELEGLGIYQPNEIHPAHIDQLGEAMRAHENA